MELCRTWWADGGGWIECRWWSRKGIVVGCGGWRIEDNGRGDPVGGERSNLTSKLDLGKTGGAVNVRTGGLPRSGEWRVTVHQATRGDAEATHTNFPFHNEHHVLDAREPAHGSVQG